MNRPHRILAVTAAGAVAALAVPVSGSPVRAADVGGHSAEAMAAPVRVELHEQTVPLPTSPQGEVNLALTRTVSSSGFSSGLASWLWPGDSVGTGFATFAKNFGLPDEIAEAGYPLQVNAAHPDGESTAADEPFPGAVMRASAVADRAAARAGFATDGRPASGEDSSTEDGDGEEAPTDPLGELADALSGPGSRASLAAEEDEPDPSGLPPELAVVVDAGGLSSASTITVGDTVGTVARSGAADVVLLAGLLRVDSVTGTARTTSGAEDATATGRTAVSGLSIAGNAFEVGSDGVVAAGEPAPVPGLPDDPEKTLAALGISVTMPPVDREVAGTAASTQAGGLRIEIDVERLRSRLSDVPVDRVVDAIPNETGELKKVLQAAAYLAPRLVITLGSATASSETVQGIELPDVDLDDLPEGGAGGGGSTATRRGEGSAAQVVRPPTRHLRPPGTRRRRPPPPTTSSSPRASRSWAASRACCSTAVSRWRSRPVR